MESPRALDTSVNQLKSRGTGVVRVTILDHARRVALWVFVGVLAVLAPAAWAGASLPRSNRASAVVLDAETGAEIFGKDADEIRAIASTTKIFVAMAVRKKGLDLDGWTEITQADAHEAARRLADPARRRQNVHKPATSCARC